MQQRITDRLTTGIADLQHLEVVNESGSHNVPAGSESHFKVTLVSDAFEGMALLVRHRRVHEHLADEMTRIHALSIHAYTPAEWHARSGGAPLSPPCMGASRGDR